MDIAWNNLGRFCGWYVLSGRTQKDLGGIKMVNEINNASNIASGKFKEYVS